MTRRALLLLALPCLAWAVALLAWEPTFWGLAFDDSFYYAQVARHIAAGHGSTFDGFHPTNGYHPLWMVFCTVVFAAGLDGDAAMRALLVLQVPMLWGALALGWRALVESRPPRSGGPEGPIGVSLLLLLTAAAASRDVARLWVNGLESGLVVLLQGALLTLAARGDLLAGGARRTRLLAGALIAGAFLARTDAALLLPAAVLWAMPRLARAPRPTARALTELLLLPSLVVIGVMVANQAWMGFPVQVSGMLKGTPLTPVRAVGAVAVMGVPALVAWRRPGGPHLRAWIERTGFHGVFAAMLVAWYACLGFFPRLWYFGPVAAWLLLAAGAGLADLVVRAAAEKPSLPPWRAAWPLPGIVGVLGLLAAGRGVASVEEYAPSTRANRDAALHVARTLPPDAVLASWDAGVLGYYADRPVVNLDGVVQSGDFLRALRAGTTADLLAPVPIGWIVNHTTRTGGVEHLGRLARGLLGPRAEPLTLVGRWPFQVFGSINGVLPGRNDMEVLLLALPGTPIPDAAWHPPELRG